jgi:hypothetical protein
MFEPAVLQRSHDLTKMSQLWNKQMSNQVQEMYVPGSQNGFSVLNGGTAEENPSTIQGRVPGWKQVGQTFVASDSKVDTQDFDKLVSTALHQGIVSNPFCNGDGIGLRMFKSPYIMIICLKQCLQMPTTMFDHHNVIQCNDSIKLIIVSIFS